MGLRKLPDNSKINIVAHNIYKLTGEHEKSLEYAMRIIAHYPDAWEGYALTAQSLIELRRSKEAKMQVHLGLQK